MLRSMIGVLGLLAVSVPALARPPQVLAPSSAWLPLKSANSCKLSRAFGEGRGRIVAVLERQAPGRKMNMMVFGPGLRSGPAGWGGQANFLPNAGHVFKDGLSARTARGDTAIQWSLVDFAPDLAPGQPVRSLSEYLRLLTTISSNELSAAAQVTGISVTEPGGNKLVLQSGPMDEVNSKLDGCAREMVRSWGLDPAVQDRVVLRARSERDPRTFIDERDYPILALRYGGEAIVAARLIVDAAGKVTNCTTISDFAEPEIVGLLCQNLSKATFEPAMTDDGTKVPDYVLLNFRFGTED